MHTNRNYTLVALLLCTGVSCKAILKDRTDLGTCGDGIVQTSAGEQCEPALPTNDPNTHCSDQCKLVWCGDGYKQERFGEECDDGPANDNSGDCTRECKLALCGDGFVRTHGKPMSGPYPYEVCDDGNNVNGDGCNPQCAIKGQVSIVAGQPGGKGTTDGSGTSGQVASVASLALSEDGRYLYATDHDSCTLRRIDVKTWEIKTMVGSPGECYALNGVGREARLSKNYQPIAVAKNTLYLGSDDVLRAVNLEDWSVTSCAQIEETHPSDTQFGALSFDPDDPNHLYAGTNHAIYSVDLPCKCASAVALSDCKLTQRLGDKLNLAGWNGKPQDGVGMDTRFESVEGLAVDASDHRMFVGDLSFIRQVDLSNWQVTTVAGSGGTGPKDGRGLEAAFTILYQMAFDHVNKKLYAIDLQLDMNVTKDWSPSWSTLRSYDPESKEVGTLAGASGSLRSQPSGELDGFGNSSRFLNARGLAVIASNTAPTMVLVGEEASVRVVLATSGQVATPVGTLIKDPLYWSAKSLTKASVLVSHQPPVEESEIVVATHYGDLLTMRVDGSGPERTLASCDGDRSRYIHAVTASGSFVYAFDGMVGGICRIDLNGEVGAPCEASTGETCDWVFKKPLAMNWTVSAIAYDGTNFYVSDKLAPALLQINESTGKIVTLPVALTNIGWLDSLAYVPKEATAGNASDNSGTQNSAGSAGWLYATSSLQNQVLRIDLENNQVHFIGTGIAAHRDGPLDEAAFCHPVGIATDGTRLFVGDTLCDLTAQKAFQGHTIRQIDNLGGVEHVSTLLGPGPSRLIESIGAQASVNYPNALTYDDSTGAIFGIDNFDNVIFKVQ